MVEPNDQTRVSDEDAEKLLSAKDNINIKTNEQAMSEHDKMVSERVDRSGGGLGTLKDGSAASALHGAADEYWKTLPVDNMPTGGLFYPEGIEVTIRSADVAEIRHWSTIDEGDMLNMDMQMNFIMEKCVRVKSPAGTWLSWQDIIEIDRFFILFRIHELTFPNGENKLKVRFKCPPNCGGDGTYREMVHLTSNMLNLLNIPEDIMQYYSPEDRCLVKVSARLKETMKFYLPTIGVSKKIKDMIKTARDEGGYVDDAFIKIAPYLAKDWRTLNDKELERLRMDTFRWDRDKLMFVMGLADKIEKSVNLLVKKTCPKCDVVLEAPIFFRDGFTIKSLFFISGELNELV